MNAELLEKYYSCWSSYYMHTDTDKNISLTIWIIRIVVSDKVEVNYFLMTPHKLK